MGHEYITLISSLPALGRTFHVDITPISRFQLDRRLGLLTDDHARLLRDIESVLHWDHLNSHYDDSDLIELAKQLLRSLASDGYEAIRHMMHWRLNLRAIVAALRYRQRGDDAGAMLRDWGDGSIIRVMEDNWQHPHFNLHARYSFLPALVQCFERDDTMGAEELLFGVIWQYLKQAAPQHYFDFTAVVRYVMMWSIHARWAAYDADKGVAEFEDLVDFAMGDFHFDPQELS